MSTATDGAGDGALGKDCNADQLKSVLDVLVRVTNPIPANLQATFETIQHAIDIANKATLGLIPWLDQVEEACKKVQEKLQEFLDKIRSAIQGLAAPWFMKCVGEKLRDGMVPRVSDFADSLDPNQLACKKSWKGDGADAFFPVAEKQQDAAKESKQGIQKLGDSLVNMGDQGIVVTVAFILALVKLAFEFVVAVMAMAAVPVGTAIGAADIIKVVLVAIGLIAAFLAYVLSASAQASSFTSAVRDVPMDGSWPPATFS